MTAGAYLRVLGGLELVHTQLSRPKPLLVLAYLCLEGGKERRHLCDLFYPDAADPRASLRVALRHIRNASGDAVETRGASVGARVPADARELVSAAERRDDERVIELYRGPFLDGANLDGLGLELEEWVLGTRERLAYVARQALLRRAASLAAAGDAAAAARSAERAYLLAFAPPLEYDRLVTVYRLLAAVASPHALRLREEIDDLGIPLDTEPAPGMEGAARTRPDTRVPNNLVPPATSFVGRERELVELARILGDPQRRLITLLGTGGVGKTRLALELARSECATARWEGVWFVALEAVTDAADIPLHIARAVGRPLDDGRDPLEALLESLGDRRVLLVLDNFDPWVETADTVRAVLQRCPRVTLLVTSRERLRLAAESAYPVEGLPLRGPAESQASHGGVVPAPGTSAELFVHRARSADLHFKPDRNALDAIAEICRLVEGAPLGIELAAAWVRAMPVEDIAARLRANLDSLASTRQDAPPRHRSLRAAFESSWQQLDAREREAFARLSVFHGGFRREDAARVTDATIPMLASLIDKSLLRSGPSGRYDLHATLHRFASQKLTERPGERRAYEERHARHFARFVEEAEPKLRSTDQVRWLERVEQETANLRAALAWSLRTRATEVALRLVAGLGTYWYMRSGFDEGRHWFARVLARPPIGDDRLRAKALYGAGRLARSQGDFAQARSMLAEALELSERLGDPRRAVECLNEFGIVAAAGAEYESAIAHFERAQDIAVVTNDEDSLIKIFSNLGLLYTIVDRLDQADALNRRGLEVARDHGDRRNIAHALSNLALVAVRKGQHARAHGLYDESIAIATTLRDGYLLAEAHLGKGTASLLSGDVANARVFLRTCLEMFLETHDRLGVIDGLTEIASLAVASGEARLAARLWSGLEGLRTSLGFPMRPFALRRYEDDSRRARALLDEDALERAREEGSLWSLAEAASHALAWLADA